MGFPVIPALALFASISEAAGPLYGDMPEASAEVHAGPFEKCTQT